MKDRSIRWGVACLLALAAWWVAPARADDRVVTLDPEAGQVTLDREGEAWLDPGGSSDVAGAAARGTWLPMHSGQMHPVHSGMALWIRFTVDVQDDSQRWYLQVPYPALDRITLYTAGAQGRWSQRTAGDTVPVTQWPVPHRHAVLPLTLKPGEPQQFYVRLENQFSFSAPLMLTSERELLRQEQSSALVLGIYFGLAGLSVMLGLLGAATTRDPAFVWYALAALLMGLSQASYSGAAGLHLWPQLPWWNNVAVLVLPVVAIAALLRFFSLTVSLPERSERLARLQALVSVACVAAAICIALVEPAWRLVIMAGALGGGLTTGFIVVSWAAWRGDRLAGWLLLGMLPVAGAAGLPMLRAAGLIPVSFWTSNALLIGIGLELPILLAVLAARMQGRRENSRRLSGLERIDPATGLVNGHVFDERLQALIARSERLRHQSVVLLIDLVNVEQVRREWDNRSAEELPLRLASRLLSCARDIDSVARLSDHRFGMLVEGPVAPAEAAAMGAKVVACCLRPWDDKPVQWVPQVRIAQTVVPGIGDAQHVLDKLGAVLAAAPADSKRAVFSVAMEPAKPEPVTA